MSHPPREVSVPAEAFDHLRTAVVAQAGEGMGVQALHAAGFATGSTLLRLLTGGDEEPVGSMGIATFRDRLASFFRERGWGSLHAADPHPGVSLLTSTDWAEAEDHEGGHPTCAFTSGVLSSILTGAAGAPVAVLETTCRARGDDACTFAFGSERTIHGLYGMLLDGGSLDEALERL